MAMPPAQQNAATTPALRGPTRSSQPPQIAAAAPSTTKKIEYVHTRSLTRQSQVVVVIAWTSVIPLHSSGLAMPSARDSGSQNTEKP